MVKCKNPIITNIGCHILQKIRKILYIHREGYIHYDNNALFVLQLFSFVHCL
jgi:hypothetical protein